MAPAVAPPICFKQSRNLSPVDQIILLSISLVLIITSSILILNCINVRIVRRHWREALYETTEGLGDDEEFITARRSLSLEMRKRTDVCYLCC